MEWSNAANWTGAIPNGQQARTKFSFAGGSINVSANIIVDQMQFPDGGGAVVNTFVGPGSITMTGYNTSQSLQTNKIGQTVTFEIPFTFDSRNNAVETFKFNKASAVLTFNQLFTVNDEFVISANHIEPNATQTNFNHSLAGAGHVKFGAKSRPIFGPAYDGSNYNGILKIGGGTGAAGVKLVSNVFDNGTFLKAGGIISVVNQGATITINGANTLKGGIQTGNNTVGLVINKNQSAVGLITMGTGGINLSGDAAVTSVAFADNSGSNWGTGTIAITGFADNEISFGTDANGLTAQQLSKITLNGSAVSINGSGQIAVAGGGGGGGGNVISTFNNGGGDNLWSNNANWTNGVPNHAEAKATIEAASVIVDADVSLGQLKFTSNTPGTVTFTRTGNNKITIEGTGVNQIYQANKGDLTVNMNLPVVVTSAAGGEKIWRTNNNNQTITFGAGHTLTINTDLLFTASSLSSELNFNGTIAGAGQLKIGAKSNVNFGSTYSGASHTGAFNVGGGTSPNNVTVVSNVSDNGTFLNNGRTLTISNQGASITVNGANTLKGNINTGNNTFSLIINKNQSSLKNITMGTGGINLSADPSVTSIAFADNSAQTWATGTIAITGLADNEVSFGSDASGLTNGQLAQMTYNGCTEVTINENGQLSGTGGCTAPPAEGNKAPSAGVDYVTVVKNKYSDPIEVLKNDSDEDGDEISLVSASSNQSNGIIDVNVNKGIIVYIPAPEFTGSETIFYALTDGTDQSIGVLYVTIEENTIPVANPKSVSTTQEISVDIDLSGSDANSDSLFYTLVDNPSNGVVSVSGDGKTIYTPNSGFFGSDSFTFKVNDGMDDSSTASVTINVTSNDTDNDGVLNADDLCPDTSAGTAVDITGCPIFELPDNNNKIQITSTSCVGSNDGSLKFSVTDSSFDYTVRLIGLRSQNQGISSHEIIGASNSLSVTGLSEGLYSACFSVNGQPGYEQCFEVLIEQPQPLSALIGINESSLITNIELEGSDNYNIEVNGAKHDVRGNNFTAALRTGVNNIKVSTDKNCQGLVEKQVFLSEEIQYYPNPTINDVNVHVSGKDKRVIVSVYSIKGELIYSREQEIEDFSRLTEIDLESQTTGTYMVTMESKTVRKVFKIVKE
jgi:hypothetical protein